jgi:hypothetical protein
MRSTINAGGDVRVREEDRVTMGGLSHHHGPASLEDDRIDRCAARAAEIRSGRMWSFAGDRLVRLPRECQ